MQNEQDLILRDFKTSLEAIHASQNNPSKKLHELGLLFNLFIEYLTKTEHLTFTTLFSRIAYLKTRYTINAKQIFLLQVFRRIIEQKSKAYDLEAKMQICEQAFNLLFHLTKKNEEIYQADFDALIFEEPDQATKFRTNVFGLSYLENENYFFIPESDPDLVWKLSIENQKILNQLKRLLEFGNQFIHVNLLKVTFDFDAKIAQPQTIVMLPNYLLDVTSVAECFKPKGEVPENFILKKFIRPQKKLPLVLGNAANQFLDALVYDIELSLDDLMKDLFHSDPLGFVMFPDDEIKKFFQQSKTHYKNIKLVLKNQLRKVGIDVNNTYTEPSFLSNIYGLQGRLDLLHQTNNNKTNNIIELKSGSVFMPNAYNIAKNHYTQTLLYDLMVNSSFGKGTNVSNYILYSKMDTEQLRFAPKATAQQELALVLRNDLIYIEQLLQHLDDDQNYQRFEHVLNSKGRGIDRFVSQRLSKFADLVNTLSALEKLYFRSFVSFIAREHAISKIGAHGIERSNGLATLWMDTIEEKIEQFSILAMLEIHENKSDTSDPYIKFQKTQDSNKLSKFRKGDIVVLYPASEFMDSPLRNQIFKCTILEIESNQVKLRFRNTQYNQTIFKENKYWNIEPDSLDSGYMQMYRNLTHWMCLPEDYRTLILGLRPPEPGLVQSLNFENKDLTAQQKEVMDKMILSKELFLLWGPPGTGKTSIMIRELVRNLNQQGGDILLLAYTNRAVDEICEAISSIDESYAESYIRIGSSHAAGAKYVPRLLNKLAVNCKDRKAIENLLGQHKIYVATIASMLGKLELFTIKSFGTIIIDEASQVLEPTLLGLMGRADKVIMIGDHKQLPAVVQQSTQEAQVKFDSLKQEVGLESLDRSLFERLFHNYQRNGWSDNFAVLSYQGRMHEAIMAFPSKMFYNDQLNVLDSIPRLKENKISDDFLGFILSKRVLFINSNIDQNLTHKTNRHEAEIVKKLTQLFYTDVKTDVQESDKYVGVITPFRAQIALIDSLLENQHFYKSLTIDTVERYQGSARDHIIFSMCMNRASQMLGSLSKEEEVLDRKFNVALTRAKESIIVIGNKEILGKNPIYKSWVADAVEIEESVLDKYLTLKSNQS